MNVIRAALSVVFAVGVMGVLAAAPIRVLLIDGTPVIKSILESSGVFLVEAIDTSKSAATQFDRYKAVVLNYDGDAWPINTMAALDKYLQTGGGLVVLPTADSAFPKWPEYNVMIGVSAGQNRDQNAGPLWFYRDGNLAFDAVTAGPAGKTARMRQPFRITIRYTDHPITKGLPLIWMHAADDLPGDLRGPGKNMTVLATAFSDAENGGTGRDEPQLLALTYGKGRVFHTLLGRRAEAMDCVGYQTTLLRGAEWAATGKVTQRIPADFPTDDKVSLRAAK
ncbi:MAG: ThuA domain-containing protein [Acidobacteriaceae bacterium]|nr:ThuA domain-containing protein [Acidobacteriaceae bacterium]